MTRKIGTLTTILILFLLATTVSLNAQQANPPSRDVESALAQTRAAIAKSDETAPEIFYRLEFTIRELDRDKLIDVRNYSLSVQSGVSEKVMAGSEVPYPSSSYVSSSGTPTKNFNYRDSGVSISCILKGTEDSPKLDLNMEISDAVPPEKESNAPAFRKVVLSCRAPLILGKPITVGVVEDPASRHRFQVDVTATKLK